MSSSFSQRASQHAIPASSSSSENSSPEAMNVKKTTRGNKNQKNNTQQSTQNYPKSPLVTGKPTKTKKRRSSVGRMTLEKSFHIANIENTKPNTSTIAEMDENSERSDLTIGDKEEPVAGLVDKDIVTHRRKYVNKLWRERRDWKQIRKNVLKMDDEDFVNTYCDGNVLCEVDVEKVYEQAEKEVKEFIEQVLVKKYGEGVRTLEDRHNYLVEKAKKEAVDLERGEMVKFANAQIDMMEMMRWKGEIVVEF